MGANEKYKTILIAVFTVFSSEASSTYPCTSVNFPTLDDSLVFTAKENETIALPFAISDASCIGNEETDIVVRELGRQSELPIRICAIEFKNGTCSIAALCTCDGNGHFTLSRTVNRLDIGEWTWKSDMFTTKTISVNIIYAAEIKHLTVDSSVSVMEPESEVEVSCTFDEGNPPVQAQLKDRQNSTLKASTTNTGTLKNIVHTFGSIQCSDSGYIRCEAPGASQNMSTTLLVKCPPLFVSDDVQRVAITPEGVNLRFDIRTHTREIRLCEVTPLHSETPRGSVELRSFTLTGTPPDLMLTVSLDTSNPQGEGRWKLTVANDAGSGHTEFWLTLPNRSVPAKVTSLSLFARQDMVITPIEKNTSVDISCTWDEGNPPVSARLLDRHGVEMEGSIYSSGQINYTFPVVGCQDAGLIRCEAPGASHNKSVTLLAKCAPNFAKPESNMFSVQSGDDMRGEFPVRTHTTVFTECLLSKYTSDVYDREGFLNKAQFVGKCASFVNLIGTPPDLVLTVRLDNVRKQDEGQWTLDLTNDVGTGHLEFALVITDGRWKVATGASAAGFALFAVTVAVICVRKRIKRSDRPPHDIELPVMERRSLMPEDEGSAPSVHIYWDADPPVSDGEDAVEEPPPPVCHGPGNPPADYLSPTASRDEKEEEGTEWNVVRFYENTQLRNTGAAGDLRESSQTTASNTNPGPTGGVSDVPENDTAACGNALDTNRQETETEYVGYDPRLYENTEQ